MNELTQEEERVIVHKGTEYPYTGEYDDVLSGWRLRLPGMQMRALRSEAKLRSGCGWHSFDDEIPGQ